MTNVMLIVHTNKLLGPKTVNRAWMQILHGLYTYDVCVCFTVGQWHWILSTELFVFPRSTAKLHPHAPRDQSRQITWPREGGATEGHVSISTNQRSWLAEWRQTSAEYYAFVSCSFFTRGCAAMRVRYALWSWVVPKSGTLQLRQYTYV